MFIFFFFLMISVEAEHVFHKPIADQASALFQFRISRGLHSVPPLSKEDTGLNSRIHVIKDNEAGSDDHLLEHGLPGQPSGVNFKQSAGNINVDENSGRSLFYYFVESSSHSSSKSLILWLNGGPGCSSLGMGAFTEVGPFGVNPDGKTLYARQFAWNQVANILFLESPAGVGFSYSNTTSDYDLSGDKRTAADTYVFLINWFEKYPQYKRRDFYLIGESYAGHYIPELADIILENSKDSSSTPMVNLKGIMIGNGLIHDVSDTNGMIDFGWSHALVSKNTMVDFHQSCRSGSLYESPACSKAIQRAIVETGNLDFQNIYGPLCNPTFTNVTTGNVDPCDLLYVRSYLNLPQVQAVLNANRTTLPYLWEPCTHLLRHRWLDSPSSMFPIYKRLMGHGLKILLYSGDVDFTVPAIGTRYALEVMGLKEINPWHWWSIYDTLEVAGYKVVYEGLTYVTVRGAGHEVSRSHPDRLYAMLNNFLGDLW